MVDDVPGVLGEITTALGRHQISIASVLQHEAGGKDNNTVPLVIMTHQASEGATQAACREIDQLPRVRSGSVRMRVRD
jgi:homoserine dehydrogenase